MKQALLFGCNYADDKTARLRGCINDVLNMETFLKVHEYQVDTFVDDSNNGKDTSANGIINHITTLASDSWNKSLTHAWVHFSGHGCQTRDWSGDERDGKDECIVPSDYKRSGLITDDMMRKAFSTFNPSTKLFLVFDCCHSGSMCDLSYSYKAGDVTCAQIEHTHNFGSSVTMLSGCMDNQTSADAYNVAQRHQFTGAMTSCLLHVLEAHSDLDRYSLFELLDDLLFRIKHKGFTQKPILSSSRPITEQTNLSI